MARFPTRGRKSFPLLLAALLPQIVLLTLLLLDGEEFVTYSSVRTIATVLFSVLTILFQMVIVGCVARISRAVESVAANAFVFGYTVFAIYRYRTSASIDFAIIADNRRSLLYFESLEMIGSRLTEFDVWFLVGLLGTLISCEVRFRLLSDSLRSLPRTLPWSVVSLCGLAVHFLFPRWAINEIDYFGQSVFAYYNRGLVVQSKIPTRQFPYANTVPTRGYIEAGGARPNVFIIIVESFSQSFVGERSDSGVEYTPFFNSLTNSGMYCPLFYANATYTIKGQEAVFCSLWPTLRGDLANHFPEANLRGLPSILQSEGYFSIFAQAALHISFANTGPFMQRVGFSNIYSTEIGELTEKERASIWGWGLEDSCFYERVFRYVDSVHENAPNNPLFVALSPIVSHAPFFVPESRRRIFRDPKTRKESFSNAIRLADDGLRTFFDCLNQRPYLKDSIIVITGDHGMPDGSRANQEIESGSYDNVFRVPLLLLWPGQLDAKVLRHSHSQVDIAPTLLSLLRIQSPNHFVGRDLTITPEEVVPSLLFQNGGGGFAVAVHDPFKYVLHLSTQREEIFDILNDPLERTNLPLVLHTNHGRDLRNAAQQLWIHQRLVEENRIWPEGRPRY